MICPKCNYDNPAGHSSCQMCRTPIEYMSPADLNQVSSSKPINSPSNRNAWNYRLFGYFGGQMLILVCLSLFGSLWQGIQRPSKAQLAKNDIILQRTMPEERYIKFKLGLDEEQKKGIYDTFGIISYTVGCLLSALRFLFGPVFIVIGALFKIWYSFQVGGPPMNQVLGAYHGIIFLSSLFILKKWKN